MKNPITTNPILIRVPIITAKVLPALFKNLTYLLTFLGSRGVIFEDSFEDSRFIIYGLSFGFRFLRCFLPLFFYPNNISFHCIFK